MTLISVQLRELESLQLTELQMIVFVVLNLSKQKFDWILLWISLTIIDGLTINIKDLKELENMAHVLCKC